MREPSRNEEPVGGMYAGSGKAPSTPHRSSIPRRMPKSAPSKWSMAHGDGDSSFEMMDMSAALGGDGGRIPCGVCGRQFNADRIAVHQRICRKAHEGANRRKTFNATEQRLKAIAREVGGDAIGGGGGRPGVGAAIGRLASRMPAAARPSFGSALQQQKHQSEERTYTDWREKRMHLLSAIREARAFKQHLEAGGTVADLPPAKPSPPPSHYVHCDYCHRSFAPVRNLSLVWCVGFRV
jgi:hypothetical protein